MLGFRVWDNLNKTFEWPINFYMTDLGELEYTDSDYSSPYPLGEFFENRFISMQFTGIYDWQDKPIYEGDVLFIYYNETPWPRNNEYVLVSLAKDFLIWYGSLGAFIKKISCDGNIYECPYLLERLKEND
jgi:hypothetical protein